MFGAKKARALKQRRRVEGESERTVHAARIAKFHAQLHAHEAGAKKRMARSPAEKTKALSNSRAERAKSKPSV